MQFRLLHILYCWESQNSSIPQSNPKAMIRNSNFMNVIQRVYIFLTLCLSLCKSSSSPNHSLKKVMSASLSMMFATPEWVLIWLTFDLRCWLQEVLQATLSSLWFLSSHRQSSSQQERLVVRPAVVPSNKQANTNWQVRRGWSSGRGYRKWIGTVEKCNGMFGDRCTSQVSSMYFITPGKHVCFHSSHSTSVRSAWRLLKLA